MQYTLFNKEISQMTNQKKKKNSTNVTSSIFK